MTIMGQQPVTGTYNRLWFELTNKCQLKCVHCYADSGPEGGHGAMSVPDWINLAGQAAADGIRMVQLIGGEPTLAPGFSEIVAHALGAGLDVEVYSNLVHVTDEMWELFSAPGVSLAFSYYAGNPAAHNAVTGRPSHSATRRNAGIAARLGIPVRAGIINTGSGRDAREAADDLRSIGITRMRTDRVRGVGRGGAGTPDAGELCGRCGRGVAAVSADGDVSPCVFSRWMSAGNVRRTPLSDILGGPAMAAAVAAVPIRDDDDPCRPDCDPNLECPPGFPGSECDPRN